MPTDYEYQYKNFAAGQLLSSITAVATSCTLQSGQGSNFPVATWATDTAFLVTLIKANGQREICLAVRTAGSDVLTFIDPSTGAASVNGRAQEGTTALAFDANDQVELRLTAAQVTTFEEEIDALQSSVTTIAGDYLTSAHNPGGADEDDHDTRYYQQTQLWTRTELAAAGGGAPVHGGNLTNMDEVNHSDLTDDEATKHRLINDSAGNGDTTELWSADKIFDELALKLDTTASPPSTTSIQLSAGGSRQGGATPEGGGIGNDFDFYRCYSSYNIASGGGVWGMEGTFSSSNLSGGNNAFSDNTPVHAWMVYIPSNIDRMRWVAWVAAYQRTAYFRMMIYNVPSLNSNVGSVEDTGTTRSISYDDNDPQILTSAAETISVSGGWYLVQFQGYTSDPTPGKYGCGAVTLYLYDNDVAVS